MSFSVSRDEVTLGNYKIGKTLGEGTFGKVKLGVHIATEQKVAVKILEKERIVDQADMERVTRQICILKILRHPNIIQLYEIIQTKKDIYLIMEYADGGELFQYIVKKKRVDDKEAVGFMQQILAGVDYLHKNGVVHRDLKPQNLLLDHNKNIKIVDFGLSNQYKPGEKLKTACGSPCYAAPQMIAGKNYECLNVDIWSCGVIMYALLCGYLPFEDPNTNRLYKKILSGQFDIPKFITPQAKDLMKKILNVDPQTRYKIPQIKQSKWYQLAKEKPQINQGIIVGKDQIVIEENVFKELENYNIDLKQARNYLMCNRHNPITSIYYLLLQKQKREGTLAPRRSQSPIVYRPEKYEQKNKTDRDYANKKRKIQMPESTKNDSMNASNIISSLLQANKNKTPVNNAGKAKKYVGDLNFDKVEDNKQFPQKEVSQISDKPDISSITLTARDSSVRESSQRKDLTARQDLTGRASIGASTIDRTRRVNQPRISLNDNQVRPAVASVAGTSKKQDHLNYSRKNQLSDQLKQISLKIDREIQQLKKQNDSFVSSQYTDRGAYTPNTSVTPGSVNRKKISLDVNPVKKDKQTASNVERSRASKIYQGMNSFSGPYNPRCVFGSNPRIVYQKILAFLQSNGIVHAEQQRFTIEVQRRLRISLQLLQNLQNVYIVTFSQKSNINEKLMNFLEL